MATAFERAKMTYRSLNFFKGNLPDMDAALEWVNEMADPDAAELLGGSVVHRDATGKFIPGIGVALKMPMITYRPSKDSFVDGGDPAVDRGVYTSTANQAGVLAYPCNQPVELFSTQYDEDAEADYDMDAFLTSPAAGDADAGLLTIGTLGTDTIVGQISRGIVEAWDHKGVAFWPMVIYPQP